MANVSYEDYQKQQAARQNSGKKVERKPVHFMKEFLDKDGDQVVVRFPYASKPDINFETVHVVKGVFPGDKYGKAVRCTGDDTCPLCNSTDEALRKRKTNFYAKMVVYNPTADGAELCATIWERPSGFADIDLANLMVEYPDLTDYLFKISRSGKGTETRYTIIPVNMQSPVYSKPVYTTKDFSCLECVDPAKILSKSVEQYNAALNPAEEANKPEEFKVTEDPKVDAALGLQNQEVKTAEQVVNQYYNPQYGQTTNVQPQPTVQPTVNTTTTQPTQTTTNSGVTRYKF